jgi:uncharacterized protein (DUF305 family)
MKRYTLGRRAALVGAALTLAGCGGTHSGGSPESANSHGGTSNKPNATFNKVDVTFVRMMIPHHQQAVELATLAEAKATDPQVKQLAGQIRAAQSSEIATMKRWLTVWGQPSMMPSGHDLSGMPGGGMMPSGMPSGMMPSGMPSGMSTMPGMMSGADMAKLMAATGKDFDKQFLQMMIVHHKGVIQMAQAEQTEGANPDAKTLAGRIIKNQQAEIATMQKMLAQM